MFSRFQIVDEGGRPKIKVAYKGETKSFYAEEVGLSCVRLSPNSSKGQLLHLFGRNLACVGSVSKQNRDAKGGGTKETLARKPTILQNAFAHDRRALIGALSLCRGNKFSSCFRQGDNKQLLDEVFLISRIIKVEVRVISLSLWLIMHQSCETPGTPPPSGISGAFTFYACESQ